MASRSADDENDSNPPGRSSSESAFLKTRGRCLKSGIWNVRTLYQPAKFKKSNTGNAKYEPRYPGNSGNTLDRRREDNARKTQ